MSVAAHTHPRSPGGQRAAPAHRAPGKAIRTTVHAPVPMGAGFVDFFLTGFFRILPRRDMDDTSVTTLVFLSTHVVDDIDVQVIAASGRALRAMPSARLWLLLLTPSCTEPDSAALAARLGCSVHAWSEKELFALFPRLGAGAAALATSRSVRWQAPYLKMYAWLHASLALWDHRHGGRFPHARWWWRLELDVLFAGPFPRLLSQTADHHADVLLPKVNLRGASSYYPHWNASSNAQALAELPTNKHAYSIVPIGRYSSHFLRTIMRPRWETGLLGMEEIMIPSLCLATAGCEVGTLVGPFQRRGELSRMRPMPPWNCSDFVSAWARADGTLWHPVKDRSCFAAALNGACNDASATEQQKAHCSSGTRAG